MWVSVEKSNTAQQELTYLIEHFLQPGARAQQDGRADFADFTFDHVVSGTVAAVRDDTRELFLLVAKDNTIRRVVLVPGDPVPWA